MTEVRYGSQVVRPRAAARLEMRPPLVGYFLAGVIRVALARGVLEAIVLVLWWWARRD